MSIILSKIGYLLQSSMKDEAYIKLKKRKTYNLKQKTNTGIKNEQINKNL